MINFKFCPKCSTGLILKDGTPHCEKCNVSYYQNSKPCASVLIVKDGKVLLGRRAKDPFKGAVDIIGGFMEYGEDPKDAAIREAKEETGLDVKIIHLLGIYMDEYGPSGESTLNIHYIGEIVDGKEKAQDDVASLEWHNIESAPENEGFNNTQQAIRDLKIWHQNPIV
jgi:ADP-ribose pyrophosphatase YjhB (NUDIX family)